MQKHWSIREFDNPECFEATSFKSSKEYQGDKVILFKADGPRKFVGWPLATLLDEFLKIEAAFAQKGLLGGAVKEKAAMEMMTIAFKLQLHVPKNPLKALGFVYVAGSSTKKENSDYNLTT